MLIIAVLRGILHYAEQYCNHFYCILKLLAIIRHKVFAALRKLCPAKLEGRGQGKPNFYHYDRYLNFWKCFMHTQYRRLPLQLWLLWSWYFFIGRYHWLAGILALAAYLVVGVVIPMWNGKCGSQMGMEFRTNFGELNSFVLDSLRGLDETIQYDQGEKRKRTNVWALQKPGGNAGEIKQNGRCSEIIYKSGDSAGILWNAGIDCMAYGKGEIGFEGILTCTIAMMGSFRTGGGTVQSVQQSESDAGKRRESSVFIGRNTHGGRNLRECGYKKSK